MKSKPTLRAAYCWPVVFCLALAFASVAAQKRQLKFEALLVWATNAEKSPNPRHRPVEGDVRRKLHELPLKWAHFFEVNRKELTFPTGESEEVTLSNRCKIKVKDAGKDKVEVWLIGQGEPVLRRTQPLPKGQLLVLGGNAPNSTGWLVVLKRTE